MQVTRPVPTTGTGPLIIVSHLSVVLNLNSASQVVIHAFAPGTPRTVADKIDTEIRRHLDTRTLLGAAYERPASTAQRAPVR